MLGAEMAPLLRWLVSTFSSRILVSEMKTCGQDAPTRQPARARRYGTAADGRATK